MRFHGSFAAVSIALTVEVREPSCFSTAEVGYPRRCPWGGSKHECPRDIQVPTQTIQKWQEIIDLLAEILHVPSALIMKVEHPNIKVFVSSESEGNPYERDELACLNTGLYCETVMKTRELLRVPNALVDQEWKANPDIKLGMISYMGFPVAWPNGDIFGTICVLDSKRNGTASNTGNCCSNVAKCCRRI